MNAILLLGITMCQTNGKSLIRQVSIDPIKFNVARVSLMESVVIPSQKGRVFLTMVSPHFLHSLDLLFEPDYDVLAYLRVNACECVVTAAEKGNVLLTIKV